MLNNIKTNQRGFTIVELLIVIVVIAILAAISIVAYNGIQTRGRVAAAASAAENMAKKLEAYNSIKGTYPIYHTTADATTQLNTAGSDGGTEYALIGSGLAIGTPSSTNGNSTVQVQLCSGTGTPIANNGAAAGYIINVFNYAAGSGVIQSQSGGTATGCVTTSV